MTCHTDGVVTEKNKSASAQLLVAAAIKHSSFSTSTGYDEATRQCHFH